MANGQIKGVLVEMLTFWAPGSRGSARS